MKLSNDLLMGILVIEMGVLRLIKAHLYNLRSIKVENRIWHAFYSPLCCAKISNDLSEGNLSYTNSGVKYL
jgi:hypothetical protein